MKWYYRLDVAATFVMAPLTVALCLAWGIRLNWDLANYVATSAILLLISIVPTFLLFVAVQLLRGEGRRLRTEPLRLSGFLINAGLLTVMAWVYSHIKAGVLLGDSHDAWLLQLDRALCGGVDPWIVSRRLVPPTWGDAFHFIYMIFLPVLIGSIFWMTLHGRQALADDLSGALVVAYYVGVLSYHLVPAYGPAYHATSACPAGISDQSHHLQQLLLVETEAVRVDPGRAVIVPWKYIAAFPSLHFSHVLILAWYSRGSRIGLTLASLFAILTAFSTIYLGWHYVVDLLAGAALAAGVIGLAVLWRRAVNRRNAAGDSGHVDGDAPPRS